MPPEEQSPLPDETPLDDPQQTIQKLRALVIKAGGLVVEQAKEVDRLKLRVAQLEATAWEVGALDFIKNVGTFLNTQIAGLPCESRIRTMDEDTWSTCMYYRDVADGLVDEKRKALRP